MSFHLKVSNFWDRSRLSTTSHPYNTHQLPPALHRRRRVRKSQWLSLEEPGRRGLLSPDDRARSSGFFPPLRGTARVTGESQPLLWGDGREGR